MVVFVALLRCRLLKHGPVYSLSNCSAVCSHGNAEALPPSTKPTVEEVSKIYPVQERSAPHLQCGWVRVLTIVIKFQVFDISRNRFCIKRVK